jgi:hypothetical protein
VHLAAVVREGRAVVMAMTTVRSLTILAAVVVRRGGML